MFKLINAGFTFESKINAREYANQVFALPKEKIGRIYLFCQNLSERSRFLAYTCYLVENYFFLSETDKDIARNQTDEAIDSSLLYSRLSRQADCVVDKMYNDLTKAIPEEFNRISEMASVTEVSAYMIGKDSTGNRELLDVLKKYEHLSVRFVSMETNSEKKNNENIQKIKNAVKNNEVNSVIYCVDATSGKFESAESEAIKSISEDFPMLCVSVALTNCINKVSDKELADFIFKETGKKPICLLAKDCDLDGGITRSAYGVDELVDDVRSL